MGDSNRPPLRGMLSFLAPAAIVLPAALLVSRFTPEKNEAYEWLQHWVMALGFALAFFSAFFGGPWRQGWTTLIGAVVALGAATIAIGSGLPGLHWLMFVAGVAVGAGHHYSLRQESPAWLDSIAVGLVSTGSCWAFSQLMWWRPFPEVFATWPNQLIFLGTTGVFIALLVNFSRTDHRASRTWPRHLIDAAILAVLAAAILRTNGLAGNPNFTHHWGVYVVPVDAVRAGHSLLGEIPSQYGFLSMLTLAMLPTADSYSAIYWLHCGTVWISGAIIYFTLRSWLQRGWWQIAAGVTTLSCVAFLSGDASVLNGCLIFPSIAAMRFIWVYLLLGFLFRHHRATVSDAVQPAVNIRTLWTGSALWLTGVLWSVESAAYVTCIWFPAATLLAMPATEPDARAKTRAWSFVRGIGPVVGLAGIFLAAALAVISAAYGIAFSRAPEWAAFWEYATAFAGGFRTLPIDPRGGVWVLVLLHLTLLAAIVSCDVARRRSDTALIWGAWGALWAVSTYFISRSHPNNIINISPVLLMILAVAVPVLHRAGRAGIARAWLWVSVPSTLGAVVWLVAGNHAVLMQEIRNYSVEIPVSRHLPPPPPALLELLARCQQRHPGPVSVLDQTAYRWGPANAALLPASWLPLGSNPLYVPLPIKRRQDYLDVPSARSPGWLLFSTTGTPPDARWVFDYVGARYTLDLAVKQDNWEAWYLVPRTPSP